MTPRRHVAVVGAGAAGLTAALRAAEAGARVTLLNAHPRIGLKILMSGGTRCNVTHRQVTERDFNGGSRHFVRRVLRAFTVDQTLDWFGSLGVELKLEDTGKYIPVGDDAQAVLDALLRAVEKAGVEVRSGARVVRLEAPGATAERGRGAEHERGRGTEPERGGEHKRGRDPEPEGGDHATRRFRIGVQLVRDSAAFGAGVAPVGQVVWPLPPATPDEWLEAGAVAMATGGLSFPRTGSDGAGYALVTALGHTLEPPIPALTPLAASDPLCAAAQGVTVDAELTLRVGGPVAQRVRGSLLFAHFGYSGPAALDLSRHWLRAGDARERLVTASFAPGEKAEDVHEWLRQYATRSPRVSTRRVLAQRIPETLAAELCREAGVDGAVPVAQLPRVQRVRLVERLLSRPMPVSGTLGYEKAEVTAGGVRLDEVNPSTLESRKVPGLYLCGEIVDVEGRLGGFNFQWAWSSGTVAGRAAGSQGHIAGTEGHERSTP